MRRNMNDRPDTEKGGKDESGLAPSENDESI